MFLGNKFLTSGTMRKASTGRSLVIEIVNRNGKDYASIKDIQDLIADHKKSVTIWRPNPYPYKPRYRRR